MLPSSIPVALLANSALSKFTQGLFDSTFTGIHKLGWFDWMMLIPYFSILAILSVYGLHRYDVIRTYFKHRKKAADQVAFGAVNLDFSTYQATKSDQPLELTPREFSILRYFLDHPNEVVSRETLLNHVWGYDPSAFTRTVDTHMARLRQKIESVPAEPRHLITVHRVGYKFVP